MNTQYGEDCQRCGEVMRLPEDSSHRRLTDHAARDHGYCRACWTAVRPALELPPEDPIRIAILENRDVKGLP